MGSRAHACYQRSSFQRARSTPNCNVLGKGTVNSVLVLKNDDVERSLSLDDCMGAIERMYRAVSAGQAVEGLRDQTHVPLAQPNLSYCLKTMNGAVLGSGYMVLRVSSDVNDTTPINGVAATRHLARGPGGTTCGFVMVFRTEDLAPVAIVHDDWLQMVRVGCTGAISVRCLAKEDAGDLALLGSGGQAWWHLAAIARVRRLRRIRVHSPTSANRERFARRAAESLGLQVEPMPDIAAAVRGADIVVAATNVSQPILRGAWLAPGAHVVSIVSSERERPRREIDDETVQRAARVVAHWKPYAMRQQAADLAQPIAAGILRWDDVDSLCDVVAGKVRARASDSDITLFKNDAGMGLQFAALAPLAYERARESGVGTVLPAELFLQSPLN
jgi:ornithine cyclodeaminase/alanine dehydrogenase-like protein (mu-crystallin family)